MVKKILLIVIVCVMLLPLSVLPVGAAALGTLSAFEKQSILKDLDGALVGDKPFSIDDYPYKAGATVSDMQPISLFEYGYNEFNSWSGWYSDYALFLYVYNPGNIEVVQTDLRHSTILAVGENGENVKYPMRLLSSSGDGNHNQLLMKFKIEVSSERLRELVNAGGRKYALPEYEIYSSGNNATAHKGIVCSYSGYMAGYGSATGNLIATVDEIETLSLELEHCVWRTDNSPLGDAFKTQLNSVYFAIPNAVLNRYGYKIAKIKYHAYQYDTGYVAVFRETEDGQKAYNLYKEYEGDVITQDLRDIPTLCDNRDFQFNCTFCYNNRYNHILDRMFCNPTYTANKLSYVLSMSALANPDSIIETALQDRLTDDWDSYNKGIDQNFFSGDKSEHEIVREIGDEPLSIDTQGAPNWFQVLFKSGAYQSKIENMEKIEPIKIVNTNDFSDFESSLYVDEYYKTDLTRAYEDALKADSSLVLFHFDTSDYFAVEVECNSYLTDGEEVCVYGEPGFVAKETVYMDFDLIDLTFQNNGDYVTLACVSNPIHVISDLQTPDEKNPVDGLPTWALVLIIVAIVLVVMIVLSIFVPFLGPIFKVLVQILLLPLKLLLWLLKAVGKGIGALFKKIGQAISNRKRK